MQKRFKIDFIGIGSERSATTWLSCCLGEHPEIFIPKEKEIYFFNDLDPHLLEVKNLKYYKGISWYKTKFKNSKSRIKGEYSPTYLFDNLAFKRIRKHFPNVKLIVTLRNPVDRAFSQYLRDKRTGMIGNISFEEALRKNNSYLKKSTYSKNLKKHLNIFPKKNMFIRTYDEIQTNPKRVIKDLYKFLRVDEKYIPKNLNKKINAAANVKMPFVNNFLIQTEYFIKRNKLDFLIDFVEKTGIRRFAYNLVHYSNEKPLSKYPKVKQSTRKKLNKYFRKDIAELENIIKKDLSSWKE